MRIRALSIYILALALLIGIYSFSPVNTFAEEPTSFVSANNYLLWKSDGLLKVKQGDEVHNSQYYFGSTPSGKKIDVNGAKYWGAKISGVQTEEKLLEMIEELATKKVPGLWIEWRYPINKFLFLEKLPHLKSLIIEAYEPLPRKFPWNINGMTSLEVFEVFDWSSLGEESENFADFHRFNCVKSWRKIAFVSDRFDDQCFQSLVCGDNLDSVYIESHSITDNSLTLIHGARSLKNLHIHGSFDKMPSERVINRGTIESLSVLNYKTSAGFSGSTFEKIAKRNVLSSVELFDATSEDCNVLASIPTLKSVTFNGTIPSNAFTSLSKVEDMKSITLKDVDITSDVVKGLLNVKTLRTVNLISDKCNFSTAAAELYTLELLREFKVVSSDNNAAGCLEGLAKVQTLSKLVFNAPCTESDAVKIAAIAKLMSVEVNSALLSDSSIGGFAAMPALKSLTLIGATSVSDSTIGKLASGTTLETLRILNGKALTQNCVSEIKRISSLKSLMILGTDGLISASDFSTLENITSVVCN